MKAVLITIGNEVLNGQVVDTNAAWLAQALLEIGIPVKEKWSVADTVEDIVSALQLASSKTDLVITTGGLGPTVDDLTSEALAIFLGVKRTFHDATFENIIKIFSTFGRVPNETHRNQCMLPEGVTLLPNKNGSAPGMYFYHNDKHVISMPGVPFEMKVIFDPHVKQLLATLKSGPTRKSHTLHTVGEGESVLEDLIKDIIKRMPSNMGIAFLPDLYKVRIRIDLDSENDSDIKRYEKIIAEIKAKLDHFIVGENDTTLELAIAEILKSKGWKLGLAESCTGGFVSHLITANSGSSAYFNGSIIAYSNDIKQKLLNVNTSTLGEYGAVSEETVRAMAHGAIQALDVDIALAISGIAGPDGGSPEKPVGTVWIGIADKQGASIAKKVQLRRDRLLIIRAAANLALIALYKFLRHE